MLNRRLERKFYTRDVLEVAPDLIGKILTVQTQKGNSIRCTITEVEAYRGEEDKACHASKGRTARTEIMYHEGGRVYVYFVYGMYWMLNFVTGPADVPQAVLIRGTNLHKGPGILTRETCIDRSFYGEDLTKSARIWVEENYTTPIVKTGKRIGIDYSGDEWKNKMWRFYFG
jgi:DNA-3-methyladenine glycosylase